jgi:ADP-heptose:LPS heptosyltransferase
LRILLVRLRQIGDVVFTTPAIHALRRRFPDAQLSYIVEPAAAPVVLTTPTSATSSSRRVCAG